VPGKYASFAEVFSSGRAIGAAAGLERIALHVERLPKGRRTSFPHAEEDEEEFVFVLEGRVVAWIDGNRFPLKPGDLVAFPAGTGIAHTFINDSGTHALLLVGGERSKSHNRIHYPLNPERASQLPKGRRWTNPPRRKMGVDAAQSLVASSSRKKQVP